ncbi:MAG: hypothetical protein V4760_02210 [Bdellovibrionota bacterium]
MITLFTLAVLLCELLDPSTSFIRSYVVPESGALSKAVPMSNAVSFSMPGMTNHDGDGSNDEPPPVLDGDQAHHSCVVSISNFDVDMGRTISLVEDDGIDLPEHGFSIFQPPKHA